jgi:nicotinamidase/pyrazinamidase
MSAQHSEIYRPGETDCLVVIDLQNDFMPGGALAVPDGDATVPVINALMPLFRHAVATLDWHPAGHSSFASSHPGRQPFETIEASYGTQVLWPDHCVQGTSGAAFHPDFDPQPLELVLCKGFRHAIDSYSAFAENDRTTRTGLAGYLRERGFTRLFFAGLATDFCVGWSVLDARAAGFEAVLIEDACRGIDLDGSLDAAMAKMREAGAQMAHASQIAAA